MLQLLSANRKPILFSRSVVSKTSFDVPSLLGQFHRKHLICMTRSSLLYTSVHLILSWIPTKYSSSIGVWQMVSAQGHTSTNLHSSFSFPVIAETSLLGIVCAVGTRHSSHTPPPVISFTILLHKKTNKQTWPDLASCEPTLTYVKQYYRPRGLYLSKMMTSVDTGKNFPDMGEKKLLMILWAKAPFSLITCPECPNQGLPLRLPSLLNCD